MVDDLHKTTIYDRGMAAYRRVCERYPETMKMLAEDRMTEKSQTTDRAREDREAFALPHERAEYADLLAEAAHIDGRRQTITGRLNVLRQRFAQRRLAAERGQPFRRHFGKEAKANA